MLLKLEHNLTNWVDGMKLSSQQFLDSENAVIDHLRDVTSIFSHVYGYGLLEPAAGEKSSIECEVVSGGGNRMKIVVRYCRAVTEGGCRIEIIAGLHSELQSDQEPASGTSETISGDGSMYAIIAVDPFSRQPFGPTDVDEYPPRNQYATFAYKVGLVPEAHFHTASASAYALPVAKFLRKGDELVRDNDYIPPCAVIAAHPGTKQLYNHLTERLNLIQECSAEIMRKVVEQGQNTPLALNTKNLCEESLRYITGEFFSFRTIYRKQSPVYMAKCIVQLANIVNLSISTIPAKEKEELLQYFSHWNDVSPGKFADMLSAAVLMDYNHEDIAESFRPLLTFLKIWTELLEKLKDLKLIGARKEGFDHAALSKDVQKEEKKGKFKIFD